MVSTATWDRIWSETGVLARLSPSPKTRCGLMLSWALGTNQTQSSPSRGHCPMGETDIGHN